VQTRALYVEVETNLIALGPSSGGVTGTDVIADITDVPKRIGCRIVLTPRRKTCGAKHRRSNPAVAEMITYHAGSVA
jgi:hypothetical protein